MDTENQIETDQLPDEVDANLGLGTLSFDPELVNKLTALAQHPDESAFTAISQQYSIKILRASIESTDISLTQRLFAICQSIIDTETPATEPNHLAYIMHTLFEKEAKPQFETLKTEALPVIRALQWLQQKRIEVGTPRLLKHLRKMAGTYFTAQTTYDEIKTHRDLANNMLLALPNIQFPNADYSADIKTYFLVEPDPDNPDPAFYRGKVNNTLYYFIILCDLFLAYRDLKKLPNDTIITSQDTFDLAHDLIVSLALSRDPKLAELDLVDTNQRPLSNPVSAAPQIPPNQPSSPTLDVG